MIELVLIALQQACWQLFEWLIITKAQMIELVLIVLQQGRWLAGPVFSHQQGMRD